MSEPHTTHSHDTLESHGGHEHLHPPPRPLQRLWKLFRPEVRDLRVIFLYALFISILSLAIPIAVEAMISTVMFGVALWPIIWLGVVMAACLGLAAFIQAVETVIIEVLQQRLFIRVIDEFTHKLPRAKLENYDGIYGPTLANRMFDAITLQKMTATILLDGVGMIIATVVGMMVLAVYHPLLLAFDVGLIILISLVFVLGIGGIGTSIRESHAKYDIAEWMQDLARIPRTFKTGAGPILAMQKADMLAHHYLEARRAHFSIVFRQVIMALLIHVSVSVVLLALGGYLVMQNQLTLGQLIAAELIVNLVVGNLIKLGKYLESWYDLCTAIEKIAVVTDLPQERQGGERLPPTPIGMEVRVRDVAIQGSTFATENINWHIQPNERVAVVGPSGSGKSLLIDMIGGLREPTTGHIELDGIDIRDLDLQSVRAQVSVIHGTELFHGSLADNLRVGRAELSVTDLRDALEAVNLLDQAHDLPNGLQTELTQTGSPLSGGQALRLCIARCLLGRPRLLILDGVLDRLDFRECPALLPKLFDRTAPWTLVIVTMNPEVAQMCDRVIGMELKSRTKAERF